VAARSGTGIDQLRSQVVNRIVYDRVIQIREQRPVGGLQGSEVAVDDKCGKYNLLEEKWIPVLWTDGEYTCVGIKEALLQAGRIRQVAASNPMDRVAVLRFLLALLYWYKGNPPDATDSARVRSFPPAWFTKLDDNKGLFNLLGCGSRFYQDSAARRPRTSTDLLQEIPSGNNFWHFRHSTDGKDGLCPACCAVGLLRLPMFSVSGRPDLKAGINGAPPIYVVRCGVTLQETLMLNWTPRRNLGTPTWAAPDSMPTPGRDVPLLLGLTLLSRRVWLHDPVPSGTCISCGATDTALILDCEFESAGEMRNDLWNDPHVVYSEGPPRRASRATDLTATGRFRMDRPWAQLLADIVESDRFTLPDRSVRVLAVGFATNQAKNVDVWERNVELPPAGAVPAAARQTLLQWHGQGKELEYRVSRSRSAGAAALASVRPHVEDAVSRRSAALLTGAGGAWDEAASLYGPMIGAVASALSPGVSTEALLRRRYISGAIPDMRPVPEPEPKPARKKGAKR
jgi:hypothetical protein